MFVHIDNTVIQNFKFVDLKKIIIKLLIVRLVSCVEFFHIIKNPFVITYSQWKKLNYVSTII